MAARTSALVVAAALLSGCAGMDADSCRGNGYDTGWRDARFKVQSRGDLYAEQCAHHGVKFDAEGYDKGYREGRWEYPDRTP